MIALVVGGRLGYRLFPVISSKRIREAIGVSGGIGFVAYLFYFVYFSLPRHDYTVDQVAVAVLWNMMLPIGIFIGIDQGIQTAAWKKREKDLLSNQD